MTQKYNYSFDLSSVFQQEEQEAVETPSTGLVPKPQAKPAETTDDSIDPMGFMPKFTEFMGATYNRAIQRHQDKTPNRSLYKDRAFEEFLGGNSDIGSLLAPATGTEINPNPIVPNPPKVTVKPMHKVASGDTLSKIAKANNTTVSAILQNNPDIKNPNKINVGQDIILPGAEPEEVATPVTTTEATPAAEPEATATASTSFTDTFVTTMGDSEGKTDHVDNFGISTLGYGILPATARAAGFDPDLPEYQDRKKLAKAVYGKMYTDATASYPKVFEGLTDTQKQGVLSLYINLGKLSSGVVTALSKDVPDFDAAKSSLAQVVLGSPRNEDNSRKKDENGNIIYVSSKGLSKRRAKEYNTLMKGDANFKPVATVEVEGTKAEPTFVWKDKDGNEINRYTPSMSKDGTVYQGLDTKSTMKAVSL